MIVAHHGKIPRINEKALVSKLATVIGDVEIGEGTSEIQRLVIARGLGC